MQHESQSSSIPEGYRPHREQLVVAVECIRTWHWLADLGAQEGTSLDLGRALSVEAADGGKATNDQIDAHKIAVLLRGDMLPKPMSIPLQCAPRATSPDAARIWRANGLSCWLVSKTLTAGIISPVSLRH